MATRTGRKSARGIAERKMLPKVSLGDEFLSIEVERTNARSSRIPSPKPSDRVHQASYFLLVRVTAIKETVYIPVSVASGRVSTGFVYQVEGTAEARANASITCRGEGITMVTLGSILYAKIPVGKTASYTMTVTIANPSKESYKVVISRINYKLNTNDARYKRFITEIGTDSVKSS